jgi:hypothetical protein
VINAPQRLDTAPQRRVAGHHLRNRQSGAQRLAQLPKGSVGYARHRCQHQPVAQLIWPDLHTAPIAPLKISNGKAANNTRSSRLVKVPERYFFVYTGNYAEGFIYSAKCMSGLDTTSWNIF